MTRISRFPAQPVKTHRQLAAALIGLALVSTVACDELTGPRPGHSTEIAFVSDRDGPAIYIVDTTTATTTLLARTSTVPFCLTWSPDGTRLAFSEIRDQRNQVFVLDVATGQQTQITQGPAFNSCPAWSPDGRRLAYYSGEPSNSPGSFNPGYPTRWALQLMNPDGSAAVRVGTIDFQPDPASWSPDGARLVAQRASDSELVFVNVATGVASPPIPAGAASWWPAWSPDGQYIAFTSQQGQGVAVYTIRIDGTEKRRISPDEVDSFESASMRARWSPDGRRITFQQVRPTRADPGSPLVPNYEVVTADPDGTRISNVTRHTSNDEEPVWRPRP